MTDARETLAALCPLAAVAAGMRERDERMHPREVSADLPPVAGGAEEESDAAFVSRMRSEPSGRWVHWDLDEKERLCALAERGLLAGELARALSRALSTSHTHFYTCMGEEHCQHCGEDLAYEHAPNCPVVLLDHPAVRALLEEGE
jgi:hypothetical protein